MYCYGDMDPEIHPGHIFERLGSHDVIGHMTIRLPMWGTGGSNFWLSHRNEMSPLTHGLNYRSACDVVVSGG